MLRKKSLLLFLLFNFFVFISPITNAQSVEELLKTGPVAGNPNGKITLVEFFDYQCSHCITMAPIINDIIRSNPNLRVVFKDFPIRGQLSDFAARAAIAANKQGKYYDFSHALLQSYGPLTEASILEAAKNAGVNVDQMKKDMNSPEVINQLKSNYRLAKELKLMGTPAFYLGKTDANNIDDLKFIFGSLSQNELQKAINNVRS